MKKIMSSKEWLVVLIVVFSLAAPNAWAQDCDTNPDADGDGWDAIACGGGDCDDSDPDRYPGNVEVCDAFGHDEDCNVFTPGFRDADGDGFNDDQCTNVFADGEIASQGDDCDDFNPSVHRIATEICDGQDNNCDGDIDGDAMITQWVDMDLDGHGDPNDRPLRACPDTAGFSVLPNDCNDGNPAIEPGDQICVEGAAEAVFECNSSGQWTPKTCPAGQVCVTQVNGTGVCVESGEKSKKPRG